MTLKGYRTHLFALATFLAGALTFLVHVAGYLPQLDPHMSLEAVVLAVCVAVLRAVTDTPQGKDRAAALVSWLDTIASERDNLDNALLNAAEAVNRVAPNSKIATDIKAAEPIVDHVLADVQQVTSGEAPSISGADGIGSATGGNIVPPIGQPMTSTPLPAAANPPPAAAPPTIGGTSAGG